MIISLQSKLLNRSLWVSKGSYSFSSSPCSYTECLKPLVPWPSLQQKQHNLLLTEIALRWVQHHSVLTEKDGVILGASSAEQVSVKSSQIGIVWRKKDWPFYSLLPQLEQNCADSEKGPLPKEVVEAVDLAWKIVKPSCPLYWRWAGGEKSKGSLGPISVQTSFRHFLCLKKFVAFWKLKETKEIVWNPFSHQKSRVLWWLWL